MAGVVRNTCASARIGSPGAATSATATGAGCMRPTRGRALHRDAHRGHRRDRGGNQEESQRERGRVPVVGTHAPLRADSRSRRTAHLPPSGCPESGQQASSVSRFTGRASSNDGTKTWPRGGWER